VSNKPSSGRWRWVSFFVLLTVLAAVGVTLPIVYNLNQQLTPEQLRQAQQRWQANGPKDYDLTYAITYDRERLAERHVVLVRGGEVVFESCEGEVVQMAPALSAAVGFPLGGAAEGAGRDVPSIFKHVETLLSEANTAQRRNFIVAVFDPREGYPRRFIRRVRGTKTREEWDVRLWPPGALAKTPSPPGPLSHTGERGSKTEEAKQ
jgi:hypothetical protein